MPATASRPEKRRRASPSVEDGSASFPRTHRQQTLTQVQYFPSRPTSSDDGALELIAPTTVPRALTKRAMPRLKKKNSTLTQMDFLTPKLEIEDMEVIRLPTEYVFDPTTPQLDGPHKSPRKQRTRKYGSTNGATKKRGSVSLSVEEPREFLPSSKNRRGLDRNDSPASTVSIRRSTRHISEVPKVLSDPVENFNIVYDALAAMGRLPFETKDSTGEEKEIEETSETLRPKIVMNFDLLPTTENRESTVTRTIEHGEGKKPPKPMLEPEPKTPRKLRNTIPSSQSPESLSPRNNIRYNSTTTPKRSSKRRPLRELSSNTPSRRTGDHFQNLAKGILSPKRKVCILKLPQKVQEPRKRVMDSQADIWTIEPSSSQKPDENLLPLAVVPLKEMRSQERRDESQPEILETSQAMYGDHIHSSPPVPANAETQESLPSLGQIFGYPPVTESQKASEDASIPAMESSTGGEPGKSQSLYVSFFRSPGSQGRKRDSKLAEVDIGEDEDFGSPIRNDTQFDQEWQARVPTSPLLRSDLAAHPEFINPHDNMRLSSDPLTKETQKAVSQMPLPVLVDRVDYHHSTATIPLNDVSSPVLPPMALQTQTTQFSARPASMPHPSQVSTQDPSQLLTSSIVQSRSSERASTTLDHITIKDSSSSYQLLSQVPRYNDDEMQLQTDLAIASGDKDDDGDDDENGDLDPNSHPPPREPPFMVPQHWARSDQEAEENDSESENEPESDGVRTDTGSPSPIRGRPMKRLAPTEHRGPPSSTQSSFLRPMGPPERPALTERDGNTKRVKKIRKGPQKYLREDQTDFTQNGHVTEARIEDMRRRGLIPPGYEPEPFQVPTDPRDLLPAWMFDDDDDEGDDL